MLTFLLGVRETRNVEMRFAVSHRSKVIILGYVPDYQKKGEKTNLQKYNIALNETPKR
jgi:hypothetical protein